MLVSVLYIITNSSVFAEENYKNTPIVTTETVSGTSRVWTDASGSNKACAELLALDVQQRIAYFRGPQGNRYSCKMDRLSRVDREYILELQSRLVGDSGDAQQTTFVAFVQPNIKLSGTVSSSGGGTLAGVIVRAIDQDTLTTLDAKLTATNGAYELTIPADRTEKVLLDFIPQAGHAPSIDELLKGNLTQQINKVLTEGPGVQRRAQAVQQPAEAPAAPAQSKPIQTPIQKPQPPKDDLPESDSKVSLMNQELKDTLDKLLSFEQIHARLQLVPRPDKYDEMLKERVVKYIQGIERPSTDTANGRYSAQLFNTVVSKYDMIAGLYGVNTVSDVLYDVPQARRCRIFPLFGRR
jgi:hypothetical protein